VRNSTHSPFHRREAEGESPEIVPTVIAAPRHPEGILLHDYWLRCRARGGLKVGRDLPAREIAKLMSKLSILEPNEDRSDFRFRLVASGWLTLYGRDVKGEWLSSLYDEAAFKHYGDGLRRILDTDAPQVTDVCIYKLRQLQQHIEYVGLPIEPSYGPGNCILIGAFHFD
jgi:hypothetical protein